MRMDDLPRDAAHLLANMPVAAQRRFIADMTPADVLKLDAMFETWAQDGQIAPTGTHWRNWLMMAGRGYGKTRAGAEWIHRLAMSGPRRRIALVGATIDEARQIMVEGRSGLLAVARRFGMKLVWEPSNGRLSWPNGSVATLFSGESPDGLRGPEHHFAWCDELAKWKRADEAWDNLQLGLRAGERARCLVTTTPRPVRVLDRIIASERTVVTTGKTTENVNLPEAFVEAMVEAYGGTRLGQQEMDGTLFAEAEGSLFPLQLLEAARGCAPDSFDRVVVGVDPPAGTDGDACGIVVAGRRDGQLWVLDDRSVSGMRPEGWARAVALAAEAWGASHVVAEANQGGAMVESVLKAADAGLKVRLVHASRGKAARAEPVAVRFETGRAMLGGWFPELEQELSGLTAAGYEGPGRSPDRADAMVWALTELGDMRNGMPRVRAL